jgi:hypothetical protein
MPAVYTPLAAGSAEHIHITITFQHQAGSGVKADCHSELPHSQNRPPAHWPVYPHCRQYLKDILARL